jgi:stage II sporulation SpoE-like protein/CAAX prenyl protease-like protein
MFDKIKWWVVIVLCLVAIKYLAPDNIAFSVIEKIDKYEVKDIATKFLDKSDFDISDYSSRVTRSINYLNIGYIENTIGKKKTRELIAKDAIPNNRWQVEFFKNIAKDQPQTLYNVWISPNGKILGFRRILPDTMTIPSIGEEEARQLAELYLTKKTYINLEEFNLQNSFATNRVNRSDFRFTWEKPADFTEGKYELNVTVQGNQIGRYEYLFNLPEEVQSMMSDEFTKGTFFYLIQALFLLAIFVSALVMFLKKYHDGEIWMRMGVLLFIIYFVLGLIQSINELPVTGSGTGIGSMSIINVQIIMFFVGVLLVNVFLGTLLLTSWAVGESYARRLWPEKMIALDSFLNKKFFTLKTGQSMLHGGAVGFIVAVIYLALFSLLTGKGSEVAQVSLGWGDVYPYYIPVLSVILNVIMFSLLFEIVFRFFIINVAYQRWKNKWLAIGISSILSIVGYSLFSAYPVISSYPLNILFSLSCGVFFGWLYFKYDLLTVIAAQAAANLVFYALPLFATTADWHIVSGNVLILLAIIPIGQILYSFYKKQTFEISNFGVPGHIKRISERERMQKELEIARNVQVGLLPKSSPKVKGFDISGTCLPAKEVGGDYFDFVTLSPSKLGIAVGDVSGKGVPAAIYMTLTKGILQSHAEENVSPKLVLNKVNKLLYRTIEKNSFVSMFYAILDTDTKKLTYARAGHNPGIVVSQGDGDSTLLTAEGIALGLEEGTVFEKTLQENTIDVHSGDTLVFYTDGIVEAMNEQLDEFGEDKFLDIVAENRNLTSSQMIELILKEVKEFASNYPQNDDITLVVIKVL